MKELWKDSPGYEGLYQVSDMGQVKSLNYKKSGEEKIMKLHTHRDGYLTVRIVKNKIVKTYKVHRLVLMTFNPINNMNKLDVNHIDENKTNHKLENLNSMNRKENINYGSGCERRSYSKSIPLVMLEPSTNNFIKSFIGSTEVERQLGFNHGYINKCCNNKLYKQGNNVYKGFRWVYLEEYINNSDYPITS